MVAPHKQKTMGLNFLSKLPLMAKCLWSHLLLPNNGFCPLDAIILKTLN